MSTRWSTTLGQAALFVVAIIIVFLPEARSLPLRAAFYALIALALYRYWRTGLLSKSLPEIYKAELTTTRTVLEVAAMTAAAVALSVL